MKLIFIPALCLIVEVIKILSNLALLYLVIRCIWVEGGQYFIICRHEKTYTKPVSLLISVYVCAAKIGEHLGNWSKLHMHFRNV